MTAHIKLSGLVLGAAFLAGCQFYARAPEDYSQETKELLVTQNGDEIKACYDKILENDKDAEGIVAVDFTVEAKTGKITDPKINEEKTTAPTELQKCVLDTMDGLALDPPDQREGVASFEYEFQPNAPKQL